MGQMNGFHISIMTCQHPWCQRQMDEWMNEAAAAGAAATTTAVRSHN